jgi:anti-sigma B factor antagonist
VNFSILKQASHTVIKVNSEQLDTLMAPEFKSEMVAIICHGETNVLIDLSTCDSCDSSGMSALLLGDRLCRQANGKFVLYGLSNRLREMIDLAEFDPCLMIADTREEALTTFA